MTGGVGDFWARLTSRISEKWPDIFPSASAVTQKAAAKLIGKSQNAGFKWKHGMPPERKHLVELALKLGVAVEWLETGRGPKYVPDPQDPVSMEIFRIVADVDEMRRIQYLDYLQYISKPDIRTDGKKVTQFPQGSRRSRA